MFSFFMFPHLLCCKIPLQIDLFCVRQRPLNAANNCIHDLTVAILPFYCEVHDPIWYCFDEEANENLNKCKGKNRRCK